MRGCPPFRGRASDVQGAENTANPRHSERRGGVKLTTSVQYFAELRHFVLALANARSCFVVQGHGNAEVPPAPVGRRHCQRQRGCKRRGGGAGVQVVSQPVLQCSRCVVDAKTAPGRAYSRMPWARNRGARVRWPKHSETRSVCATPFDANPLRWVALATARATT